MSSPARRPLLVGCALAIGGCDPVWVLKGLILDGVPIEGKHAPKPDARRPLSGAKVSVRCSPDGWARDIAVSPDGSFSTQGLGYLPGNCSVFVERAGYIAKSVSVSSVCTQAALLQRGFCQVANLTTQLSPAIDDAKTRVVVAARPGPGDGGGLPDGGPVLLTP